MIVSRDSHEPVTAEMFVALRNRYPSVARLDLAFRLAQSLDDCIALWRGEHVPRERLDPIALVEAREQSLVQLVAPLDLLPKEAA